MSRDKLFLEERAWVARQMVNEDVRRVFGELTPRQRDFVLRLIAVLDGERYAVPRKFRHLVRRVR